LGKAAGTLSYEIAETGPASATGDVLCFVDPSIEQGTDGWLEMLAGQAWQKGIGAVGPMILDPSGAILSAGYVLGLAGGVTSPYYGRAYHTTGVPLRLAVVQNVSAVPGWCLVIRNDVFRSAGGFGADASVGPYRDIDLCLRLMDKGFRNVWTPWAEVVLGRPVNADSPWPLERLRQRHPQRFARDPFYNPNLSLGQVDPIIAFPPRS
jgi:O-antigen biosynthesis protein